LNRLTRKVAARKAESVLEKVGLLEEAGKKIQKYSRGMRQRLGLADVLIRDPEAIILDEPTLGIDPEGVKELLSLIRRLSKEEGLTVALSSHHLHQVQKICDRVGLFVSGQLVAEGDIQTLSQKLFGNEAYTIHAGVAIEPGKTIPDQLYEAIKNTDGVVDVNMHNGAFQIGCSRDASPGIAKAIVNSGFCLQYLHREEFGLDEIYHRYFEGGGNE